MQRQLLQQAEFCRGELDTLALAPDLALLKIDLDISKTLRADRARCISPTGASQHSMHARHKLPHAKRFRQVVVRALVEGGYFIGLFSQRRPDDDRDDAGLPNATTNLQPI